MATAKQIGMVGAFVVALIVGAPGTASAQAALGPQKVGSSTGKLVNVGDELQAAGSWKGTSYVQLSQGGGWGGGPTSDYWMELDVSCRKLTPGATYVVIASTSAGTGGGWFVAGEGAQSGGRYELPWWAFATLDWITVCRVDGDDLVPVLAWSAP